ncbi:MAG: serine hydrolase domain-containing protein [Promethearchaeota archaeon]
MSFLVFISSTRLASGAHARTPDYWPTTDWLVSLPEAQGMNSTRLQEMQTYYLSQDLPLDSVLVIKNGYIVYEDYPSPGYDQQIAHIMYSCTKSVTSALTGIAINLGLYDLDDLVLGFFPERTIDNRDSWKEAITVEDLLMMRSGIAWDEWTFPYGNMNNYVTAMVSNPDAVQYVLDLPMWSEPGTEWLYNTGASHLLSAILTVMSGNSTLSFADEYLFEPLGITRRGWGTDHQGVCYGGHNLFLRPRDMAKFGFLYLNDGNWAGQQIVPADWVATSTSALSEPFIGTTYGYQWWSTPGWGSYSARGYQGQYIFVFPDYDLVIVFTGTDLNGETNIDELILDYILPSIGEVIPINTTPLLIGILGLTIGIPIISVVIYRLHKRKKQYKP